MNKTIKFAGLAAVVALAGASFSASAWWGGPGYGAPYGAPGYGAPYGMPAPMAPPAAPAQ